MKTTLPLLLGALFLGSCGSTGAKRGWQDLMRAEQWRGYNRAEFPSQWNLDRKEKTLRLAEKGGGDLITVSEYQSFELEWEWQVASGGNSGVMFHVIEGEAPPWATGPEYQLLDNVGHPDGANPLTSAGANYAVHGKAEDDSRPAGEWNESRLIVMGTWVEHYLNGVLQCEYELWSEDWEQRVEASKWKNHTAYGRSPVGHVVLQDHGDEVWFRNMRIRRL